MNYSERLKPNFSALLAVGLLFPATWLVLAPIVPVWAPIAAGLLTAISIAAVYLSAPVIRIEHGQITAGHISLATSSLGAFETFCGEERRKALGVNLDARAQLCTSPWVDCVVRLEVTDPKDPTPYIVLSTRRPEQLLALLKPAN